MAILFGLIEGRSGRVTAEQLQQFRVIIETQLEAAEKLVAAGLPVTMQAHLDIAALEKAQARSQIVGYTGDLNLNSAIDEMRARGENTTGALPATRTQQPTPALELNLETAQDDQGPALIDTTLAGNGAGGASTAAGEAPTTGSKRGRGAGANKDKKKKDEPPTTPVVSLDEATRDGVLTGDIVLDLEDDAGPDLGARRGPENLTVSNDEIDLGDDSPAAMTPVTAETKLLQRIADALGEEIPSSEIAADDLVALVTNVKVKAESGTAPAGAMQAIKGFMTPRGINRVSECPVEHRAEFAEVILKQLGA